MAALSVLQDRSFMKQVMKVAIPPMLQQLITSSVNLLDNLMVGQLGSMPIAAVASSNKYIMIINFGMMAVATSASIFIAQYHGAEDEQKMKESFRYCLLMTLLIVALFIGLGFVFMDDIIRFFSNNPELLAVAKDYFPIALITVVPQAISHSIQSSMRAIGDTKRPLISSVLSLSMNGVMNYLLIFGVLFFPALGVKGAALGTLIARLIELAYLSLALKLTPYPFKTKIQHLFSLPKQLFTSITKKAFPLFCNEVGWAAGMAVLFKFYVSSGDVTLAALPIASTTADIFFVLFSGVAVASLVLIAHPLGANEIDLAKENGYKMVSFSLILALLFAVLMLLASFLPPYLYNTSAEVMDLAVAFIRTQAIFFMVYMYNAQIFFVLRAGGDTRSTLLMDAGTMWLLCIPVVALVSYFTNLNPILVYVIGQLTDIPKMLIARYYFKKEKWLVNLTHHAGDEEIEDVIALV